MKDSHTNSDTIVTVPVPSLSYEGTMTIEYLRGIYTGYSQITRKHHFSLFNGKTVALETLKGVVFDNQQ